MTEGLAEGLGELGAPASPGIGGTGVEKVARRPASNAAGPMHEMP